MSNFELASKPLVLWLTSMLMNVHCPETQRSTNYICKIKFDTKLQSFYLQRPQTDQKLHFPLIVGLFFWQKGNRNDFTVVNPVELALFGKSLTGVRVEITNCGTTHLANLTFNESAYTFTATPTANIGQPMFISVVDMIKLSQEKTVPDVAMLDKFNKCISSSLLKLADV